LSQATQPASDTDGGVRRISFGGAVVVLAFVAATLVVVKTTFGWVQSKSHEWSLASARRVVDTSLVSAETKAGLLTELGRLEAAFEAQAIDYAALFASLQRIVEGTLIPVTELRRVADTAELDAADAAAFRALARTFEGQAFVPEGIEPVLEELRAGAAPKALAAQVRALTGAAGSEPVQEVGVDPVETFRALVDATLAGNPPPRFDPR